MIPKKVYSERIFNALIDICPMNGKSTSVKDALQKHKLSRSLHTIFNRCGYLKYGEWITGFPTIEQAEKAYDELMKYQKESIQRNKSKKLIEQGEATLFEKPQTMTESQALDVLKNSRLYDYKVFRSPKKSIEEQVL